MNWVRSSGSMATTDPLVAPDTLTRWSPEESPWRWWVFFLFCWLSASNAIVSMTFSSLPVESQVYYLPSLTPTHINVLLMWASILPLVGMIPTIWLLTQESGVVRCMKLGASFTLLGCIIRYIPCLWSSHFRHEHSESAVMLLHVGQILNACAYPLFMASPSQLSATWFASGHRNTITAVSVVFCEIGYAIAFFIPSFSINLPLILFIELVGAALAALCTFTLIFMPIRPRRRGSAAGLKTVSPLTVLSMEIGQALRNQSFMIVAVCMGICGGAWTGWCPDISAVMVGTFTEEQGDQLSLVANLATIIGGIAIGPITDRFFPHSFKWPMVVMMVMCVAFFSWFTLALPTPSHYLNRVSNLKNVRKESFATLNIPVILTGFLEGATVPLAYELCSQLLYPLSEGTSGGLYQLFVNSGQLLFLLVPITFKKKHWYNFWCLFSIVVGLCGVLSVNHVKRPKLFEAAKTYGL